MSTLNKKSNSTHFESELRNQVFSEMKVIVSIGIK